jgi:hypothetical protein
MANKEANSIYIAKDVYPVWKRRVVEAIDTITVFTPFLDKLLVSLLGNAQLANDKISVITDFNPSSILESPNQLLTIKRLLSQGINIYSLNRLHAKVLLIDDNYAVLGSQNFTSYGRKSKECSSTPIDSLSGTKFVETLSRWQEEAVLIDEELVDLLISKLTPLIRQQKALIKKTQSEFSQLFELHEQEKQEALIKRLEELELQSRIRLSQGAVFATIEQIGSWGGQYDSLKADYEYDMTRWTIKHDDGHVEPYDLKRLSMYPMILADNNRMGFARIGKTRITYIRKSLSWTNRRLIIGGLSLSVSITFPETDTKKRNIVASLGHDFGTCEVSFLFTGDLVRLVKKRFIKPDRYFLTEHKKFIENIENDFITSPDSIGDFFQHFFSHFTYKKLGREHKNVRDYLKGDRFRVSIIQYEDNPFVIIKKIQ